MSKGRVEVDRAFWDYQKVFVAEDNPEFEAIKNFFALNGWTVAPMPGNNLGYLLLDSSGYPMRHKDADDPFTFSFNKPARYYQIFLQLYNAGSSRAKLFTAAQDLYRAELLNAADTHGQHP